MIISLLEVWQKAPNSIYKSPLKIILNDDLKSTGVFGKECDALHLRILFIPASRILLAYM